MPVDPILAGYNGFAHLGSRTVLGNHDLQAGPGQNAEPNMLGPLADPECMWQMNDVFEHWQ
jgi:hypothetical protein